ncbi:hypothetical protein ACI780_05450 [Geodermatophilus sp. SYSU D00814]
MGIELRTDPGTTGASSTDLPDLRRPNVAGDLPTVLAAGPMFDRALAGYDRFQVDTYVRWAEDELATAEREREHLLARHLATATALAEARDLLAHSSGGAELVRVSGRIAALLAAAADHADGIRAEARADRRAAAAEAEQVLACARGVRADAAADAERVLAVAAAQAEQTTAEAGRVLEAAEQARRDTDAAIAARLAEARAVEDAAAEHAAAVRRQAADDAAAARLHARQEIVRMLDTGREQRQRADDEAAAVRQRLDRDAAARRGALLAEVAELERRRDALRAATAAPAGPVPAPPAGRRGAHPRRLLHRFRPGSLWAR